MANLLSRLFGRAKKGSGATAKDRLRFVLQHDRINLPPERMEEMKSEILAVIVKYLVVDKDRVEIDLEQRDRMHSKLTAEIPVAINTPPAAQRTADGAKANGATSNGSDAEASDADAEPEARESPDESKNEKADEDDSGEAETGKKK